MVKDLDARVASFMMNVVVVWPSPRSPEGSVTIPKPLRSVWPLVALVLAGCGTGGGSKMPGASGPVDLALQLVTDQVAFPVFVTAPPGDTRRLFVVEKTGRIWIVRDGVLLPQPFLDVQGEVSVDTEQGLLGLAFDPQYSSTGIFYITLTATSRAIVLYRWRVSSNPDRALATRDGTVLSIDKPDDLHNAGMIAFGPDGYLWVSVGDGDGLEDVLDNGQRRDELFGSLLRLDVRNQTTYAIPRDNPFMGRAGMRGELWSYGLRNPWRFTFDRQTGDLYIGDVGNSTWEEVDVAPTSLGRGRAANYGWKRWEGPQCDADTCDGVGFTPPALAYDHSAGCAVIGGYVYRGSAIPALRGTYFYGDYCEGWVKSFHAMAGRVTNEQEWPSLAVGGSITSFGQDATGELYIVAAGPDRVFRIINAPAAP
jgi:glucose/arabinose dehydrogenase